MSRKSLQSIQKEIVMNDHTPLRERIKTLKQMECPSVRFLRTILDSDAPDGLRRAASRLLAAMLATPKPQTLKSSSLPSKLQPEASRMLLNLPGKEAKPVVLPAGDDPEKGREMASDLPVQPDPPPKQVMPESFDSEGRRIIAADLWDLLTLAGTELYAPLPGCVRGPDPEPHPPCPEQTPEALAPHNWRDAGGGKNETTF